MFQELMPLLGQRILVLTLARTNTDEVCVNVIPKPLKLKDTDENQGLSTPLSVTGTPAELDQELPKQLVEFVAAHLELSSTLQSAKEELAAAAKSARDGARKANASKSSGPSAAAASGPACKKEEEPVNGNSKAEAQAASSASSLTGSLFEAASGVEG